jgi:hypothetical protein
MTPLKSRPILLTFSAFATGTSLGTLASYFIAEGARWDYFFSSLILSPIVMTLGTANAAAFLPKYYSIPILAGVFLSVVSLILACVQKPPFPQYLLCLGSALWALGNVTGLHIMMSV